MGQTNKKKTNKRGKIPRGGGGGGVFWLCLHVSSR